MEKSQSLLKLNKSKVQTTKRLSVYSNQLVWDSTNTVSQRYVIIGLSNPGFWPEYLLLITRTLNRYTSNEQILDILDANH